MLPGATYCPRASSSVACGYLARNSDDGPRPVIRSPSIYRAWFSRIRLVAPHVMSLALVISMNESKIYRKESKGQRVKAQLRLFDPLTLCDFLMAISATYFEVRAAASVHPKAILVAPPCATKNARRAAALTKQANLSASERAFSAIMALLVAGLAIEGLRITATAAATVVIAVTATVVIAVAATAVIAFAAGHKIGATAAINPDAASVKAPRAPRDASRVAALAHQPDAAASIGGAIITSPVVRSAI